LPVKPSPEHVSVGLAVQMDVLDNDPKRLLAGDWDMVRSMSDSSWIWIRNKNIIHKFHSKLLLRLLLPTILKSRS